MSDCPSNAKIEAYHDGELSAADAAAVERHLPDCPACTQQLAQLREMSALLAGEPPAEILPIELARIHRRLERLYDRSFLRFCAAMSAVAASVLIISSVWLFDGTRATPIVQVNPHNETSWERVASGQKQPEPHETGVAVKETTDWMVVGMGGSSTQ